MSSIKFCIVEVLLFFLCIHMIKSLKPTISPNVFLGIKEGVNDLTCTKTPNEDGICLKIEGNKEVYNYCAEGTYCGAKDGDTYKCVKALKLYKESCTKDSECMTQKCSGDICVYKNIEEDCKINKECDEKSYCYKNKCTKYLTKDDTCSDKTAACSPQFVCASGKCKVRATEAVGTTVEKGEQCKTFKRDTSTGKCTDKYFLNSYEDWLRENNALNYPNITWDKVKLSDYDTKNMGDYYSVTNITNYDAKSHEFSVTAKGVKNTECLYNILKQIYTTEGLEHEDFGIDFTLTDRDYKYLIFNNPIPDDIKQQYTAEENVRIQREKERLDKIREEVEKEKEKDREEEQKKEQEKKEEEEEGGLSIGIIILIILTIIIVIALIGFAVFYCMNKNQVKSESIES